jgi:transcription factor E
MLEKFLKDVVIITVGKQAEEIVPLLDSKKHVNEFIIAKKLDITINQTRNILYKLSDYGLVSSIRKKDKKKGWYTYFWKMEKLKALEFLKSIIEKKKEQIQNQIRNRESKQFYVCETCRIEFNEENALLHDFTCNECGNTFTLKDNTKLLRELKRNLTKLEKELEFIEEEVTK